MITRTYEVFAEEETLEAKFLFINSTMLLSIDIHEIIVKFLRKKDEAYTSKGWQVVAEDSEKLLKDKSLKH